MPTWESTITSYPPTRRLRTIPLLSLAMMGLLGTGALAAIPIGLDSARADREAATKKAAPAVPPAILPPAAPPEPLEMLQTTVPVEDWERLADCESGQWTADGDPEPGSAQWDYGIESDHGDNFEGGLNFHPTTWEAYRDPDMPGHAGRASRVEEMQVAERVLDEQGWEAWPVCSAMMDLAE